MGDKTCTQSTYIKQKMKLAPLKVYFFFMAFNNSKHGFQRHRKVFLWGIYAAPTSGAVQTQAHLGLCSLGAADKWLLTSPYFQTISEISCRSTSLPHNFNDWEHFSRNPVGVQKFEFLWPGRDPLTRVVHAELLFAVFVGNPPLGDHRRVGGTWDLRRWHKGVLH